MYLIKVCEIPRMFQGCCFVDFCRLGTSVIYALPGFACCTGLFTLVLNWSMGHGSLSALCTTPVRQNALQREHTVTNAVSWTFEAVHTQMHVDKQFSKKNELLLSWNLGVSLAFCQTDTSLSLVVICKGSFHGFHKISFFCLFLWRKSMSPRPHSALSWMHVLAALFDPHWAKCVCLHLTSFEGRVQ